MKKQIVSLLLVVLLVVSMIPMTVSAKQTNTHAYTRAVESQLPQPGHAVKCFIGYFKNTVNLYTGLSGMVCLNPDNLIMEKNPWTLCCDRIDGEVVYAFKTPQGDFVRRIGGTLTTVKTYEEATKWSKTRTNTLNEKDSFEFKDGGFWFTKNLDGSIDNLAAFKPDIGVTYYYHYDLNIYIMEQNTDIYPNIISITHQEKKATGVKSVTTNLFNIENEAQPKNSYTLNLPCYTDLTSLPVASVEMRDYFASYTATAGDYKSFYPVSSVTPKMRSVIPIICTAENGDSSTVTVNMVVNNHRYTGDTENQYTIPSTCLVQGGVYEYCADCKTANLGNECASKKLLTLPLAEHTPNILEWKHDGTNHWRECAVDGCNEIMYKSAHSGGVASCTKAAVCSTCGVSYSSINGDNHVNMREVAAVEATHTKTGIIHHWYCKDCKKYFLNSNGTREIIEAETISPVKPHDENLPWISDGTNHWKECSCGEKLETAAHSGGIASCTKAAVCSTCGASYGSINGDNHVNMTEVAAVEATHAKTGIIHHWYCKDCKKYFLNSNGTEEITEAETISPVKPHDENLPWISDGTNHWKECSCGEKLETAAHIGGVADCSNEAVCEICKSAYGPLNPKIHLALNHVVAMQPTHTKPGNINYWYCKGCEKYYKDAEAIDEIAEAETVIYDNAVNGNRNKGTVVSVNASKEPTTGDFAKTALWFILIICSGSFLITFVLRRTGKKGV